MTEVVSGGIVLAGTEFEVFDPGFVVMDKGRIVEVGSGRAPGHADAVFDATGTIVAPAFLNGHTHVSDAIAKERAFGRPHWEAVMPPDGIRFRAFQETAPATVQACMHDTLKYMVACGTSTFVDFREGGIAGVELLKEAASDHPIRAIALGRFATFPPQPADMVESNRGALKEEQRQEVRRTLQVADGFSTVSANDLTDQALEDLNAIVRGMDKLLTTHVAESPEYRATSMERTSLGDVDRVLNHLRPDFVVHLTDATEDELDRLADASMPVVVCPRIQGVMGLGFPRFDRMIERGMLVALGTDNMFLASPDLLRELDYSSRVIRGLRKDPHFPTAVQMLQMITINPARMIGRGDDLGSLEAGKCADLVVFDATSHNLRPVHDPVATLVNRAEIGDIKAVFHEGKLVFGPLQSVDGELASPGAKEGAGKTGN